MLKVIKCCFILVSLIFLYSIEFASFGNSIVYGKTYHYNSRDSNISLPNDIETFFNDYSKTHKVIRVNYEKKDKSFLFNKKYEYLFVYSIDELYKVHINIVYSQNDLAKKKSIDIQINFTYFPDEKNNIDYNIIFQKIIETFEKGFIKKFNLTIL